MSLPAEKHILIIDDQPETLAKPIELLEKQGFKITIAANGRQGFHLAQVKLPNLILLDVHMPKMNGFATCALLKQAKETSKIPVLFLTSASEDEEKVKGLELGAYDYITKPFNNAELLARIKIHLSLTRQAKTKVRHSVYEGTITNTEEVLLQAALKFMRDNMNKNLTLDLIAKELCTYSKKISRLFRKYLSTTVFNWYREEKINFAKNWLVNTNMEVQDIATELNFKTSANFSTAFRQVTGLTPSEYRKKLREQLNID